MVIPRLGKRELMCQRGSEMLPTHPPTPTPWAALGAFPQEWRRRGDCWAPDASGWENVK